jgi:hypothetical protein
LAKTGSLIIQLPSQTEATSPDTVTSQETV